MKLDDLIRKREQWVESSRDNNFDFNTILAGLYADPSHFIYELLQNAEDEGAKQITIRLFKDKLEFYHDGKNFDVKDIDGVTGLGNSKKKEDLNAIGKFGVGFKSVFAVTRTPYIFSGEYKIKIRDFVVPVRINSEERIDKTLIRLPFNHDSRSQEEIFELTKRKLENLELKTLLFLKNIEEIKWETPSSSGHYLRQVRFIPGKQNANRITLISSNSEERYLVIEKQFKIEDKDLKVEIAFKLGKNGEGKEIIIPEQNSRLVVFFPTEKVTYLNFIVHGPFRTVPNRENIPLDNEQNKVVLEEIGNLVSESLPVIKSLGYLDVNFLNTLPIDPATAETEKIYSVIYDKVKEIILAGEFLPTAHGKYTKPSNALLARSKELTEFLTTEDIQLLFDKEHWLDTNITNDKTPELRDYMIEQLDVQEVDFGSFARRITPEFLQTKSDEWMIDFYRRLLSQQSLWSNGGILRTRPMIRLETNDHIAPFNDDDEIQVYLPSETKTGYKTVKRVLVENEESLKFLKELGLRKPDLFAEIKEFVMPKYQVENPVKDEWYFEDFKKLLRGYEKIESDKRIEFVEELSSLSFIYATKNDNMEEARLLKPSETYFGSEDLKRYFDGYHSVYFVSSELYEKVGEEKVKRFLKDLGVEDKPRRIEIEGKLTWEEKRQLRGSDWYTREIYEKDYEYEGLESFINDMTPEKSYLLWKLLLKNIESLSSWGAQEFFKGEYKWFYYSEHLKKFDARFLKILKERAWLVDKSNYLKKPCEITPSDLSDGYSKESPNGDILIGVLGFESEAGDHLSEDDRKKLEIVRRYPLDYLERVLGETNSQAKGKQTEEEEKEWIPECEPEECALKIQEVKPDKIVSRGFSSQILSIDASWVDKLVKDAERTQTEMRVKPIDRKAIGRWGEKYVYEALKRKYEGQGNVIETDSGLKVMSDDGETEIVWLNKYEDRGKGYDFAIRTKGSEMQYIEVKTKTGQDEELVEVTGAQWEFARRLSEEGHGETYSFYVVFNAGKRNAEIRILRNPIDLWKEGKLYAHPVNFKL